MLIYLLIFFFFFQAEDGIRDVAVTGVQTCALPISRSASEESGESQLFRAGADVPLHRQPDLLGSEDDCGLRKDLGIQQRSRRGTLAKRASVGETVVMKWHTSAKNILLAAAFASLWGSGCGSSSTANQ